MCACEGTWTGWPVASPVACWTPWRLETADREWQRASGTCAAATATSASTRSWPRRGGWHRTPPRTNTLRGSARERAAPQVWPRHTGVTSQRRKGELSLIPQGEANPLGRVVCVNVQLRDGAAVEQRTVLPDGAAGLVLYHLRHQTHLLHQVSVRGRERPLVHALEDDVRHGQSHRDQNGQLRTASSQSQTTPELLRYHSHQAA